MTDILDARQKLDRWIYAIAGIGVGFRSAGLDVPEVIILKDHDQGMRLISKVHQHNLYAKAGDSMWGKPIEQPDGSVYMEIELMGMKIRWPAMKMALQKGGYSWI